MPFVDLPALGFAVTLTGLFALIHRFPAELRDCFVSFESGLLNSTPDSVFVPGLSLPVKEI